MEFLALAIWLLLAGTAAVVAPFAVVSLGAGISALAAFGGTAACVLYIVLDAPEWAGWVQLGLAVLGILGATLAAVWLSDDRVVSGSTAEGLMAGAVGVQLPFYCAVTFVALLIALEATDPVV
jgi:hypothetical protein